VATHRYIEDEHIELAIGAVARIRGAWHLSGRHQTGGLAGNVSAGLRRPCGSCGNQTLRPDTAASGGRLARYPCVERSQFAERLQSRCCQPCAIAATIRPSEKSLCTYLICQI
jgi:hypothetical protein